MQVLPFCYLTFQLIVSDHEALKRKILPKKIVSLKHFLRIVSRFELSWVQFACFDFEASWLTNVFENLRSDFVKRQQKKEGKTTKTQQQTTKDKQRLAKTTKESKYKQTQPKTTKENKKRHKRKQKETKKKTKRDN